MRLSEETQRKISEAKKGKHHTDKTKRKMSVTKSGPNNPNYGKHPSDETRKKQSEAKAGARNSMYGRHHTEESKMKMSLAAKKLWTNSEYRERALVNLISKGKHQTEKIKVKYR